MTVEHVDVLVVGAGVSGIDVASRVLRARPATSLLILEGRDRVGGTWDVFRYPGVRSDSDLFTLGFPFRPWTSGQAIVGGERIRQYIADTAEAEGLGPRIRFGSRVTAASWSSADRRWTVDVGGRTAVTCAFLVVCAGYYRTERGYEPRFPGAEAFTGSIVHPQRWPAGLELAGRDVVVVGSGAGAVSLVPAVARLARTTTMLQRTPSHVISIPSTDRVFTLLRRVLPGAAAAGVSRARWIALYSAVIALARIAPGPTAAVLRARLRRVLPADVVARHFTPPYRVWDQRLCLTPDGELLTAIRSGRAQVVTDRIARFTPDGLLLDSGRRLRADVVVTATGLELQALGGIALAVDGEPVDPAARLAYKGLMLDAVPNLAFVVGSAKLPWTLRADAAARYLCRLLHRLDRGPGRPAVATPASSPGARRAAGGAVLELDAGYFRRGADRLPRRGPAPWRVGAGYPADLLRLRFGPVTDRLRLDP